MKHHQRRAMIEPWRKCAKNSQRKRPKLRKPAKITRIASSDRQRTQASHGDKDMREPVGVAKYLVGRRFGKPVGEMPPCAEASSKGLRLPSLNLVAYRSAARPVGQHSLSSSTDAQISKPGRIGSGPGFPVCQEPVVGNRPLENLGPTPW